MTSILPSSLSLISLTSSISEDNPALSPSAVLEAALYIRNNDTIATYYPIMASCFTEVTPIELSRSYPNAFDAVEDWFCPTPIEYDIIRSLINTYSRSHHWQFITPVRSPEGEVTYLFWNCISPL